MLVLRNTLRGGRHDGWWTTVGVCTGLLGHALLSAAGLSLILASSALAFQIVKLVGAGYLIWLGVRSWMESRHDAAAEIAGQSQPGERQPLRSFREGVLTNLLNPKVAIFYLAFLPQFVRPEDPVFGRSLLLATVHNAMGLVWLGVLSIAVSRGRRWLGRGAARRWIGRVSGTLLVALGLRLALAER